MNNENVYFYPKLDYAILAKPDEYYVDYEIYNIVQVISKILPNRTVEEYEDKWEFIYNGDTTENIKESTPQYVGSVKWDGCSNWNFSPDGVMIHFCSEHDIEKFGKILLEARKLTAKLINTWQGD